MARKPRSGDTKTPDDRNDRRSLIVPDELWKHVQQWAKEQDKSEAAIVRNCIEFMLEQSAYRAELRAIAAEYQSRVNAAYWEMMDVAQALTFIAVPPDTLVNDITKDQLNPEAAHHRDTIAKNWNALRDAQTFFQTHYLIRDDTEKNGDS